MSVTDTTKQSSVSRTTRTITLRDMGWSIYIPVGISAAVLIWLYQPIFAAWYAEWMKEESYYSHGILVPFISLFIVWLKKKQLLEVPIKPSGLGYITLVPLLAGVVLMLWAGSKVAGGLTLPLVIASMVLLLFGWKMLKELAFPIGYLFFMCVLPGFILIMASFRIQMMSTAAATMLLKLMGFGAYRDGAMILLPNIEVMVGAPCSGFRLLISLLAFAVLFAYLKEGPLWGRLSLIAFTAPLSLIVNSIRITLIAMVGEFMGAEAMHAFHDYSGYIVLVLAFVILWFVARLVKCEKFNSMLVS